MLVWVVFGSTLRDPFLNYDDNDYIYENPQITSGLSISGIEWAFTHFHASNWHPLTTISHMVDCQLYGLNPWGPHFTNVLLHSVATVLLFLALRKLTLPRWSSAIVAALFAIHPLRVESVAWISERKDVLSGVFFMLTLWAYADFARASPKLAGKYFRVLLFFALGLLCKPTLVTLPFVLLLLDYWPLGRMQSAKGEEQRGRSKAPRPNREARRGNEETTSNFQHFSVSAFGNLVIEKVPFFLLSAASCVVTVVAQKDAFTAMQQLPFQPRFANAVVAYVIYLGQTIWPAKLAVLYPYPVGGINAGKVILALIFLWVVSAACFLQRKRNPFLIVGWLWFLGVLVPMIGLIQVGAQPRADRYTYLASIGLYLLAVYGIATLSARFRIKRNAIAAIALIAIGALGVRAYLQTSYWRDSETLWRHAIATTSKNHVAEDSLGNALFEKGNLDEAIVHYRAAIAIKPDFAQVYSNLGNALLRGGQPDEAIVQLRQALRFNPNYADAYNNLGGAFMKKDQPAEAVGYFKKAIEINPNYGESYNNLGVALLQTGDIDGAIADYEKAVASTPGVAEIQCNLGNAYARKSNWTAAIAAYQSALKAKPDYAQAHNNLGVAFQAIGKFAEALQQFNEAVRLHDDYAEAQFNLGDALIRFGRRDEAIVHLGEALRLKPDYDEAKKELRQIGIER